MATKIDMTGLQRSVATRAGLIVRRTSLDMKRELDRSARKHRQTGAMEAATRVTDQRLSPTLWRITAENPTVQAATTDGGARPHEIRPRRKQVLRFVADGRVVYARVVHHPGNRGSGWFRSVMSPAGVHRILSRFVGR